MNKPLEEFIIKNIKESGDKIVKSYKKEYPNSTESRSTIHREIRRIKSTYNINTHDYPQFEKIIKIIKDESLSLDHKKVLIKYEIDNMS